MKLVLITAIAEFEKEVKKMLFDVYKKMNEIKKLIEPFLKTV